MRDERGLAIGQCDDTMIHDLQEKSVQVDEITGDVNRSQLPRALFHIDRARRIA